jgi:hypothetical protein
MMVATPGFEIDHRPVTDRQKSVPTRFAKQTVAVDQTGQVLKRRRRLSALNSATRNGNCVVASPPLTVILR